MAQTRCISVLLNEELDYFRLHYREHEDAVKSREQLQAAMKHLWYQVCNDDDDDDDDDDVDNNNYPDKKTGTEWKCLSRIAKKLKIHLKHMSAFVKKLST